MKLLTEKALKTAEWLFANSELQAHQEYANIVSIKRLGYNDHGPVHMRKATLLLLKCSICFHQSGIKMNLEKKLGGNCRRFTYSRNFNFLLHLILEMAITRKIT